MSTQDHLEKLADPSFGLFPFCECGDTHACDNEGFCLRCDNWNEQALDAIDADADREAGPLWHLHTAATMTLEKASGL